MPLIIGVDPAAQKIACVALDPITGTYRFDTRRLYAKGQTKQTPASLSEGASFMRDFAEGALHMAPSGQRFAYVEPPMVGRGGIQTAIKQGYIGGVIRACLAEAGFQVYEAPLTSWRSGFMGVKAGKGRTTAVVKLETASVLRALNPKLHSLVAHDGDLIDAAGIALYGAEQVRKAGHLTPSKSPGVAVQGGGPDVVLRPARVRRVVRR